MNTSAPAGAHLTYFGGRVVSNVQVVQVLWGSGSYASEITSTGTPSLASMYQQVSNSAYFDWLTEYNTNSQAIGHGSFAGQVTITPSTTSTTIDDTAIQSEISAQIAAGHLPAPTHDAAGNDNTYYAVFFPHGDTITQGGSSSCVAGGFAAYHGTIANAGGLGEVYYGVQPDFQAGSGCDTGTGTGTRFQNETSVATHEMVEMVTDPEVGLATVVGPPLAWYDNTNGEIGDICNGQEGSIVGGDGQTYTVQFEFSNVAGDCIVTRVVPNDFSIAASPTSVSVNAGSSATTTISTAVISGSAQTIALAASGLPSGVTASFSPSSVTAGGSSTLTLSASGGAPAASNVPVTVSGSATSGTHTASVSLSVVAAAPPNDFSITANPTSVSIAPGSSGTSSISTATTSGSAQTISLSASGMPSGVSAALSPASVSSGQSSTLTISASSSAASGTFTITVTGSATSGSHATGVVLSITGTFGGGGLTNGGFEAGTLAGWTSAGASETVVSSGCHGGVYCSQLGSTSPTNGDSKVAQTFTAPTGATGLSLWYKETCPDTITYDWALATLKDNTAGTTANVVTKSCATTGWTNVSGSLTAGHSYTLTLVSHDDNYAGDSTYTLYDDVTITTGGGGGGGGGITNGGFESGSTGWLLGGASATITASGCHGGSGCALLGSLSPTNGDSTATQTFTVPAGKSQLSFWYKVTCPDTLTYDWANVTLKDTGTGTTTTALAKTCANSGSWVNKTVAVTAGHTYKLTLVSHDDNYAGDSTYTLYDDVTLN